MTYLVRPSFPAARVSTVPALDVEVAFNSLPTEGPVWRTIASDVRALSVKRGRPRELDRFSAGVMTATLDNNSRDYDPENSSSPVFGHVLPEKRVRVLASYNSVQYVVFDGFVDGWPQEWLDFGKDAQVQLSATDGFKVLAQADVEAVPWNTEVAQDTPLVWHKLGDFSATGSMTDSSGNGYHGVYSLGGTSIAGLVAQSLDAAVDFDGTDDYARGSTNFPLASLTTGLSAGRITTNVCVEMWIRTSQVPAAGKGAVIACIHRGGSTLPSFHLVLDENGHLDGGVGADVAVNDGQPHHVFFMVGGGANLYVDGVGYTIASVSWDMSNPAGIYLGNAPGHGNANLIPFDGVIDEFIIYPIDLNVPLTRTLAHYNAGKAGASGAWGGDRTGTVAGRILDFAKWPTEPRDLDTGSSTVGPHALSGNALDYLQTLFDTEQGQMYMGQDGPLSTKGTFDFVWRQRHALITAARSSTSQATFSDTGSLRYSDLELVYDETKVHNDARVTRSGGAEQTASNAASQAKYFKRTYDKSGLLYSSDNDSFDHATWAVNRYKDPRTRVEAVTIKPQDDPANLWPQVLTREIGDRITVTRSGISKEVIIEGKEHDYDGEEWTTTFRCSPADLGPYWLLDDAVLSVLDSTTIPAF